MSWTIMCAWGKSGGFYTLKLKHQYHIGIGKFAITFMNVDMYPILENMVQKLSGD